MDVSEQRPSQSKRSVAVKVSDLEDVLELNFVPQWARNGQEGKADFGRFDDHDMGGHPRSGRGDRRSKRPDRSRPVREMPRRQKRGEQAAPRGGDARGGFDPGRRSQGRGRAEGGRSARPMPYRPARQEAPLPPVVVRFLPEQQHLLAMVKQVAGSRRAYPLMDLAHMILEREGWCFVKITPAQSAPAEMEFHVCKRCGLASLDEASLRAHVMSAHFEEEFAVEEIAVDPPAGNFVCVAKCGLSGEYLGPPNHHSYNERIREVHAARYAHMPMAAYRARIQLLHDPEEVDKWRECCSRRNRYRRRAADGEVAADAEPLTWAAAQAVMRDELVPACLSLSRKAVMNEGLARQITDPGLRRAVREEWQSEMRFPVHLAFALRAAFRHKRLFIFKAGAGKGVNFVTGTEPNPIDPETTIDEIKQVLSLLHDSPGMTKAQILEALLPGTAVEAPEARNIFNAVHWLTERGHIIEFFNGCLSVPLGKHAAGKAAPHRPSFGGRPRGNRPVARGGRPASSPSGESNPAPSAAAKDADVSAPARNQADTVAPVDSPDDAASPGPNADAPSAPASN